MTSTDSPDMASQHNPDLKLIVRRYQSACHHPFSRFKTEFRRLDLMLWLYWAFFALSGFFIELLPYFSAKFELLHLWHQLFSRLPTWVVLCLTVFLSILNGLVIFPVAQRKSDWRGLPACLLLLLAALPLFGELAYCASTTEKARHSARTRLGLPLGLRVACLARFIRIKISLVLVTRLNLGWILLLLLWIPAHLSTVELEIMALAFRVTSGSAFLAYITLSHRIHPQPKPWRAWLTVFVFALLIPHPAVLLGFFILAWSCFPTRTGAANPLQKGFRGTYQFTESLTETGRFRDLPTNASPKSPRVGPSHATKKNPFWIKHPLALFEAAGLFFLSQTHPFPTLLLLIIVLVTMLLLRSYALARLTSFPVSEMAWTWLLVLLGTAIAYLISDQAFRNLQILLGTWAFLSFNLHLFTLKKAVFTARMTSWVLVAAVLLFAVFACKSIVHPLAVSVISDVVPVATLWAIMCGPLWLALYGHGFLQPFTWRDIFTDAIPNSFRYRWFLAIIVMAVPLGGLAGPLLRDLMAAESPALMRIRLEQIDASQAKQRHS